MVTRAPVFGETARFRAMQQRQERYSLPASCSVVAIGVRGDICFYRLKDGLVVALRSGEHNRKGILHLFRGHEEELSHLFPAGHGGWNHHDAAMVLMAACSWCGVLWDTEQYGFKVTNPPDKPGTYRLSHVPPSKSQAAQREEALHGV